MEQKKTIVLNINLGEVCMDVVTNCNLISKQLGEEVDAEIKADIKSPDSDETRSIVCRAATEAIGEVKYMAQRYLKIGRREDTNTLERLGYMEPQYDEDGHPLYDDEGDQVMKHKYEVESFELDIPSFNYAVTDSLKSAIHKYVVDHIMWRLLQNQVNDKAGEYKELCDKEDRPDIIKKLNARVTIRKPRFL